MFGTLQRSQDLGELEPQLFSRVGRAGDGDEHETKFVELERQVKLIPELEVSKYKFKKFQINFKY